jgi:glycosyltransferase involved in cell wall biosynthesis
VKRPAISVVVPARNEAERLGSNLRALFEACAGWDVEVVVVDDASTDATAAIAEATVDGRGRVLRVERHRGKGAAVRAGVRATRADRAVFFMDADLATDLEALPRFVTALEEADIVVGSRVLDDAVVLDGKWYRAIMGRAFNVLARRAASTELRDTQCGFKAFRGPVAHQLFGLARSDGYAFDVEVLLLARHLELKVVELPVTWTAVSGSSVRPVADSFQMAVDAARIAFRWRSGRAPQQERSPGATSTVGDGSATTAAARKTLVV